MRQGKRCLLVLGILLLVFTASVYAEETDISIINKISTLNPDFETYNNLGQTIEIYELNDYPLKSSSNVKNNEPKIIMFNKDTGDYLEVHEGILDLEGYEKSKREDSMIGPLATSRPTQLVNYYVESDWSGTRNFTWTKYASTGNSFYAEAFDTPFSVTIYNYDTGASWPSIKDANADDPTRDFHPLLIDQISHNYYAKITNLASFTTDYAIYEMYGFY